MKRLLIFLLMFLCAAPAWGTVKYVSIAALGGGNTGADWTNAYTCLDSTTKSTSTRITRGDTVFVADGTYNGTAAGGFNNEVDFTLAESGTDTIWVLKAVDGDSTWDDHGTNTGWSAALGDGQALFTHAATDSSNIWDITTGYWCFDGRSRTSKTSGHGFKLQRVNPGFWSVVNGAFGGCYGIYVRNVDYPPDNIEFSYIEIQGVKDTFHWPNNGCAIYFNRHGDEGGGSLNVTIQYCYSHDCDWLHIISGGCENWLVQYNYFHWNYELGGYMHSQCWADYGSDHMVFRYNEVWDIEGTSIVTPMGDHGYTCDDWQIYGNVFGNTAEGIATQDGVQKGVVATTTGDIIINSSIYNNTITNVFQVNAGSPMPLTWLNDGTGNSVKNNLIYQGGLDAGTFGIRKLIYYSLTEEDSIAYNVYIDAPFNSAYADSDEVSIEKKNGDPFTDLANGDVTLTAPTEPGLTLASPFDTDMNAVTRGDDGTWDRGAFEYAEGGAGDQVYWYVNLDAAAGGDGTIDTPYDQFDDLTALTPDDVVYHWGTGDSNDTLKVAQSTVTYKKKSETNGTTLGARKAVTFTNMNTSGTDSVNIAANNDDSFFSEQGALGWSSNYSTGGGSVIWGEANNNKRTNTFLAFNNVDNATTGNPITSVTSATISIYAHLSNNINYNYDIRGITSLNVTAPTDSNTFKALYDTLSVAAETGTMVANGDSVWYHNIDVTDAVNAVLGQGGFSSERVGLMLLTDITGLNGYLRFESYENAGSYEARLHYTYGTASDWYYAAIPAGSARNFTRVWRGNTPLTKVDTWAELNLNTEYYKSADGDSLGLYFTGVSDTTGITIDGQGYVIDFNGKTNVEVSGFIIDGQGSNTHAVYSAADSSKLYNLSLRDVKKGFHLRGNIPKLRNVAVDAIDTVFTVAGQDSFLMAASQAVPDSGFEVYDTPWQFDLWNEYEDSEYGDNTVIQPSATYEHSGTRCAQMRASADNDSLFVYDSFTLLAGQWYQLEFWFRVSASADTGFYRIVEDDEADRDLQTDGTWDSAENKFLIAPADSLVWTKYIKIFKSADDTNFTIYFGLYNAPSDTIWFDDARIKPVDITDYTAYDSDNVPTEFAGTVKVTSQDTLFEANYYPVSALVNMGTDVGLDYTGRYPDIGAVEDTLSIVLVAPNGGESLIPGSVFSITYNYSAVGIDSVKMEYSTDSGSTWTTIIVSEDPDGSYSWTVPAVSSTTTLVRVVDVFDGSVSDVSDAVFTVGSTITIWYDGTAARYGIARPIARYGDSMPVRRK